ncbi:uncharacterized protein LOC127137541 [Lathyrus oleraceus]|uniref:uncharacterized protein LOC127137541 n=1 Tax=Pisum sativum TaxID=3888 RepID=UPI0021CE3AC6|nr:uncharacterized protein LOC127137541 [Pisum sativum]
MSRPLILISALTSNQKVWKIVIRVIDLWIVKEHNGLQHVEAIIHDAEIGGSGKKACINVTLSDDCGAELDVTLWESYANQHTSYIKDNAPPGVILTHDWSLKSLSTRKLNVSNAWNGSKLLLNYDHPQVTAFKSNFEDGKPYSISSQTMSVNFASQTAFEERSFSFVKDMKTIGQIMSLKDDTFCNTIGMTKRFKSNRFV